MPRRRRSYRRPRGSYVWQTYANTTDKNLNTNSGTTYAAELFSTPLIPGTGDPRDTTGVQTPFTNDHTLERIRGEVYHEGRDVSVTQDTVFPLVIAAVRIPAGFSIDRDEIPNLFDNTNIGNLDIIWQNNTICDAASTVQPSRGVVDQKSRRKFEVGDQIKWYFAFRGSFTDSNWYLEMVVNLRFLWKLKV